MKKLFPLLILVILGVSLPSAMADTESLYVDGYTGDLANWDERNEPSPYLADESTGFVHEIKSSGATEGYFGFADPSGTGTINSVTLYIECYGEDTNDLIYIYVDCSDGGGWVNEGTITVNQLSYDWETLSLSTRLDSWPDIQNAQIYFYYQGVGGGDDIYVRRAYLFVDYTEAGAEYTRGVSQSLSWSGIGSNTWDATRSFTQSLTLSSDSSRTGDWSRTLTQGITIASSALADIIQQILVQVSQGIGFTADTVRNLGSSRTLTQGLSLTSASERLVQFMRNPVQSITASVETLRSWSLARTVTQSISIASESLRSWAITRNIAQTITVSSMANRTSNYVRTFQQGLSFTIETFTDFIAAGGEAFYRTVTMGIDFTVNSIRRMSLSRIISQSISLDTLNAVVDGSEEDDPPLHGVIIIQDETTDEPPEQEANPYVEEATIIIIGSAISYIYKKRRK